MGREVRRVPKDWVHPVYTRDTAPRVSLIGTEIALFAKLDPAELEAWDEGARKWSEGLRPTDASDENGNSVWEPLTEHPLRWRGRYDTWEEWIGERPNPADFMPTWSEDELTHLMMYETTTEGTPISPAFETGRELARWLADNKASVFGSATAPYEDWLRWIEQDVGPKLMGSEEEQVDKPIWAS